MSKVCYNKTYEVELTGTLQHDVSNTEGEIEKLNAINTGKLEVDWQSDGEISDGVWEGGVRHDIEVIASSLFEAQEKSKEVAENLDTGSVEVDWDFDDDFAVWKIDGKDANL